LLLATPLTVCLLVVGKHVPQLSFLNILLGSERVFDLKTRVYQRLLAGDLEEADDLIKETLTTSSLAEVYDTVLIPALALAESDRRRGNIDAIRQNYIFQSLKETVADLGERQSELSANQTSGNAAPTPDATGLTISPPLAKPCILLMPARDDADEIAAMMLAHLMETSGFRVETISETTLAGELVGLIAERRADVVCISAMPPGVARQTRYLCKRMQGKLPDDRLIVGLWNSREELGKARIRIGCAEAVRVVSTLVQAHLQIQAMVQSLPVQPQQSDQSEVARLVPGGVKS
jgi:methylmalonyl-CoA mutase cobalamin-binding subunit